MMPHMCVIGGLISCPSSHIHRYPSIINMEPIAPIYLDHPTRIEGNNFTNTLNCNMSPFAACFKVIDS